MIHLQPLQKVFTFWFMVGIATSVGANLWISFNFGELILQLQPRAIISGVAFIASFITILTVFKITKISSTYRMASTAFTLPFSAIDYGFLFHNIHVYINPD